jgi:predicted Rossmann-fold nucleotide-binding protein
MDHAMNEGFVFKEHRNALFCESDPNKLLDTMAEYEHPHEAVKRWMREE